MASDRFLFLLTGLVKFLENGRTYPYPIELAYTINSLSSAMLGSFPKTIGGMLQLFGHPLHSWWPFEIPEDFDPDGVLIYDDGLALEVIEYLDQFIQEAKLPAGISTSTLSIALDNRIFHKLIQRLRQASLTDPQQAESEYVSLRRFLIEHSWTTTTEILDRFSSTRIIRPQDVGEMYDDAPRNSDLLAYPDENGTLSYWNCEHCGPLRVSNGRRHPIKLSACGPFCLEERDWHPVKITHQMRIVRKGIQLRTCIPGLHELRLHRFLLDCQAAHPTIVTDVQLWPGIDRYDLRIQFPDSVWAVDVKDYKDPYQLGHSVSSLYRQGELSWDRAFYVYPYHRDMQRNNYGGIVQREAKLPHDIQILSETSFQTRIREKIRDVGRDY